MARLFVAIHPPIETATRLLDALHRLEPEALPEHRPTRVDKLHLTLLFLGEIDARDVDRTAESVERAAAGVRAFELGPEWLLTLPQQKPARVLAATTNAPSALVELRKRLVQRLSSGRRRVQGFVPHLTLCRFTRPTPLDFETRPLDVPDFPVEELSLMQSRLEPEGSEHRRLLRVELRPARTHR